MKAAIWFSAGMVALALAAAPALFGEIDYSAEQTTAAELAAMQAEEAAEARKQVAGNALCKAERGAGSEARWTVEGHLVCRMRNGYVRVEL
jgi:type II secretory pathway pseudopilin PulG